MAEHSPLPWMRGIDLMNGAPVPNYVVDANRKPITDRGIFSFEDAELVVHRVNGHDALLAALKNAALCVPQHPDFEQILDEIDAAIAKAEPTDHV